MRDTAGEVGTRRAHKWRTSVDPLHVEEQKQGDQLDSTLNSTVPKQDVALKTFRKQVTIGRNGERGSGISVLMAWHDDDDDDDDIYMYIYRIKH